MANTIVSRASLLAGIGLLAAGAAGACAATSGSTSHGGNAAAGGATSLGGSLSGAGGGGAGGAYVSLSGSGGDDGGVASCQSETHAATTVPLDVYIVQDQSTSMTAKVAGGGTKWDAVTAAISSFVQQPGLAGISVGLNYFALPATGNAQCSPNLTCTTDADCGPAPCGPCMKGLTFNVCMGIGAGQGDSCAASVYAMPDVEIAALPGVASAVVASLAAHGPLTGTPTAPALQGAVDHAKAWATSHPGHVVVAVLATDGEPDECTPTDAAGLAQIAAAALAGTPSIKTFGIGTFAPTDIPTGPDLLNAIAAAGGTGQAFDIDTTQNVSQAFLAALNQIRATAACQFEIPVPTSPSATADPSKVNVQYTPGGGTPEIVPQVPSLAACPLDGDGWYYDDPSAPMQILLCPGLCSKFDADAQAKVEILLGCKTVTETKH